jgi:ABC-2 type transport system permease protein
MAPGVLSLAILLFMILTVTGGFTKEKLTGSTERVLICGTTKTEIILGYLIGNSLIALIQCSILLAIARFVFNVVINGSLGLLFLALFIYAISCVGIGILASSAARTELQAFQFIPLLLVPFMILSGFIYPIAALPKVFQYIAAIIPMTYCIRIGRAIMINGFGLAEIMNDLLLLILITVIVLVLSILSFRAKRN